MTLTPERSNDPFVEAGGYPELAGVRILRRLSSGGMGDVLLARRQGPHGFEKWIAIKTIRSGLALREDYRKMFFDEARLMARLEHPAIVHVYDFGEAGDFLYLTMEYVSGLSFSELLRGGGPLPPGIAVRLAAEAAKGLHAAHELKDLSGNLLNVVHRDVSPQNLFFAFDGHVKILDFGIALMRDREQAVTQVGTIKGKPQYMAPEQLRGGAIDRRSDVFALGVVLHELLSGEPLFSPETLVNFMRSQGNAALPSPLPIEKLPKGLNEVVAQALALEPAERFQDARAMAAALDRVASYAGAETLEAFAERALAAQREAHDAKLKALLDGDAAVTPPRPRGPTVVEQLGPTYSPTTKSDRGTPTKATRRSVPRLAWVLGPVVVAGATAAVWMARTVREVPTPTTDLAVPSRVQTPEPPVVAPPPPPPVVQAQPELPLAPPKAAAPPHEKTPHARSRVHAATEPAPAAPTGVGFLNAGAEPYALVRLDGRQVGVTPIFRMKVPAGAHELELVSPDDGQVRLKRSFSLTDGQETTINAQ